MRGHLNVKLMWYAYTNHWYCTGMRHIHKHTRARTVLLAYFFKSSIYSAVARNLRLQELQQLKRNITHHKVCHPRCVYNKLDCSVCTCLTQLYDGTDMYIIYYIKNN